MVDVALAVAAGLYLVVVFGLLMYGLNFTYMTFSAVRHRHERPTTIGLEPPNVTVQIPIFNEPYVAARVIDAVGKIDYPWDRLTIQILDDSTDETKEIAADSVRSWRRRGLDMRHIHRDQRDGYKAGALAHGLRLTGDDYIAIFDADFTPSPDFLNRSIPALCASPELAFIQGRWTHTNRNQSILTRVQALSIDGHFTIEQQARWTSGYLFNFNGTAGVWRRAAVEDAGGWSQRTLTEDLDISYRALLRGWRAAYLHDLEVPAELPASMLAYRQQQDRWARGSFQCASILLPQVWRSSYPLPVKLEATLHLTGYLIHLLLLALVLLFPPLLVLSSRAPNLLSAFEFMALLNVGTLAPSLLFLTGQWMLGRFWRRDILDILFLPLVGVGMMLNTSRAAARFLAGKSSVFVRTPKLGNEGVASGKARRGYRNRMDWLVVGEIGAVALCAWTARTAWMLGAWSILAYATFFGVGVALVSGIGLWQATHTTLQSMIGRWGTQTVNDEPPSA